MLLLLLELPPSRQSPSHVTLLKRYTLVETSSPKRSGQKSCKKNFERMRINRPKRVFVHFLIFFPLSFVVEYLSEELTLHFKDLVLACQMKDACFISEIRNDVNIFDCITIEQQQLLDALVRKYR